MHRHDATAKTLDTRAAYELLPVRPPARIILDRPGVRAAFDHCASRVLHDHRLRPHLADDFGRPLNIDEALWEGAPSRARLAAAFVEAAMVDAYLRLSPGRHMSMADIDAALDAAAALLHEPVCGRCVAHN